MTEKEVKLLSLDEVLKAPEAQEVKEVVEVPEWGGSLTIRALNAVEAVKYGDDLKNHKESWRILLLTVINPIDGSPLFNEGHLETLGKKSFKALCRVRDAATRLSYPEVEKTKKD